MDIQAQIDPHSPCEFPTEIQRHSQFSSNKQLFISSSLQAKKAFSNCLTHLPQQGCTAPLLGLQPSIRPPIFLLGRIPLLFRQPHFLFCTRLWTQELSNPPQ